MFGIPRHSLANPMRKRHLFLAAPALLALLAGCTVSTPGSQATAQGQKDCVSAAARRYKQPPESFVVELTASEAEVNQFVTDLGERTEIVEVVRSGALAVGRSARALHVVR